MLRNVARVMLLMVLLSSFMIVPVSADSNCDSGDYCYADYFNLYWPRETTPGNNSDYTGNYPGSTTPEANTTSSAKNNGGGSYSVHVYDQPGLLTKLFCLKPGTFSNFYSTGLGNKAQSHIWVSGVHPGCF